MLRWDKRVAKSDEKRRTKELTPPTMRRTDAFLFLYKKLYSPFNGGFFFTKRKGGASGKREQRAERWREKSKRIREDNLVMLSGFHFFVEDLRSSLKFGFGCISSQ